MSHFERLDPDTKKIIEWKAGANLAAKRGSNKWPTPQRNQYLRECRESLAGNSRLHRQFADEYQRAHAPQPGA